MFRNFNAQIAFTEKKHGLKPLKVVLARGTVKVLEEMRRSIRGNG
jgi:hypothetical protein